MEIAMRYNTLITSALEYVQQGYAIRSAADAYQYTITCLKELVISYVFLNAS
jgi:hypothetical protein